MSSAALPIEVNVPPRSSVPFRRLVRAHLIDSKYEFIRMLRSPGFVVPVVLLPVVMYLAFGIFYAGAMDLPPEFSRDQLNNLMFTNFTVFGVMGPGLGAFGVLLAVERDQGMLDFKRALPMPPFAYLLSKLLMALLFGIAAVVLMTIEALVFGDLNLSVAQYLGVGAVGVLGVLPFCAIGMAFGSVFPAASASPVVNLVYVAMAMVGGLLVPLPEGIRWITLFSPPFYVSQLNWGIVGLPTIFSPWVAITLLVVMTVLLTWFSVRRLNRSAA